jgi:uncharacterized MAPEG superfamily protein
MTVELWMLFWAVVLTFVQVLVAVTGASSVLSPAKLAGNREDITAMDGWVGRAQRAHRNMLENLPLFAALVLIVHVAGAATETSALGAEIFVFARLAYAVVYIIGIPWVRTALWFVSVIGMVMVALALF